MSTLTDSFAIGYLNHASGSTITATTSATGYLATNLSNPRLGGVGSSHRTTAGSLTTQNIDVDLASAKDIDVIALIGTNLEDSATRTPVTSEASNYTSPEYNPGSGAVFNLTYPDLIANTRRYGRNLIVLPGSTLNSRYVRVTLNNSGHASNYLSSRVFWVGPLWQPLISFGMKEGTFKIKLEPIGDPGIERAIKVVDLSFDVLSEGEAIALETICTARLRTGRLLIIPRPDQPATWQAEALYCTLQGLPQRSAWPQGGGTERWKVQLSFRECED